MASIDKTYIDGKNYPLYRQWWIDNYDKMIKELGDYIWLYPFSIFAELPEMTPEYLKTHTNDVDYYKKSYDFPIWNTSEAQDKWLIKHCEIKSFRDRLIEVYPHNWIGFKGQKWISKPKTKQKYRR